jgi:mRNA interferase RelE/StbE
MTWRIDYSKDAHKFIQKNKLEDDVSGELKKFLLRLKGVDVNIDLKKLVGDWDGYYRLRKGDVRIIFAINKQEKALYVEKVDLRVRVYK